MKPTKALHWQQDVVLAAGARDASKYTFLQRANSNLPAVSQALSYDL
jgi:hypothetical protein